MLVRNGAIWIILWYGLGMFKKVKYRHCPTELEKLKESWSDPEIYEMIRLAARDAILFGEAQLQVTEEEIEYIPVKFSGCSCEDNG